MSGGSGVQAIAGVVPPGLDGNGPMLHGYLLK